MTDKCMRNTIPEVGEVFESINRGALLKDIGTTAADGAESFILTLGCITCSDACQVIKNSATNTVMAVTYPDVPESPVFSDEVHCIEF
jgi:hypothetical protein